MATGTVWVTKFAQFRQFLIDRRPRPMPKIDFGGNCKAIDTAIKTAVSDKNQKGIETTVEFSGKFAASRSAISVARDSDCASCL